MTEPVIQRKYSIMEIDAMRKSVEDMLMEWNVSYNSAQRVCEVEEHLRTYMMAGVDPGELAATAKAHNEERDRLQDERDEAAWKTRKS